MFFCEVYSFFQLLWHSSPLKRHIISEHTGVSDSMVKVTHSNWAKNIYKMKQKQKLPSNNTNCKPVSDILLCDGHQTTTLRAPMLVFVAYCVPFMPFVVFPLRLCQVFPLAKNSIQNQKYFMQIVLIPRHFFQTVAKIWNAVNITNTVHVK